MKLLVRKLYKAYNLLWSSGGQRKQAAQSLTGCSMVMGGDGMIDETAWQRNKAVSLTPCWS